MEHSGTSNSGNTKTESDDVKKEKRCSPSKYWCFTLNNYKEEHIKYIISCLKNDKYIIGREVSSTGTPHLQGYIECNKRIRPLEKFRYLNTIHWERRRGTSKQAIEYCMKDDNYVTNFRAEKPLKLLDESKLYVWQKEIIKIITEEPDDRKVYWFWDEKGCAGKTTFCKYLASKYDAIPLEGKKNDILFCAATFESDLYVWDIERSMESYISYAAIEKIKNGFYMSSKYESKPIIRNNPHVIIFANFPPDKKALSEDRWVIKNINEEHPILLGASPAPDSK